MANNINVKDAAAATVTMKTTDNAGVHTAHHNVDSSALPAGAATEATLLLVESAVDGIEALLGGTLAVSAASLPLPTGAATEATLASALTSLQTIDNAISGTGVNISQIAGSAARTADTDEAGGSDVYPAFALVKSGTGAGVVVGDANPLPVGISSALPAGTNNIGGVTPKPGTSGGLLIGKNISAASTNATSLKGSAGQIYSIYAHNINAAVRYLKLYNKATSPTVGTDTPVITFPIPGNAAGNGAVLDTGGMGIEFATGIAYALTTGVADSDTGAVAANEIVLTVLYK